MTRKKIAASIIATAIALSAATVMASEQTGNSQQVESNEQSMVSVLGGNKEDTKITKENVEAVPTLMSTIDDAIADGKCQKSAKASLAGALECLRLNGVNDEDIMKWSESDDRILNILEKYPRLATAYMTREEESTIYSYFTTKENLSQILEDKDVKKAISEYLHPTQTGEYGAGKVTQFYKALEGKETTLNSLAKMVSNNPDLALSVLTTTGGLSEKEAEDFIVFTDGIKVEVDSNGEVWRKAGGSSNGWELTAVNGDKQQDYVYTFHSDNKEMEKFVQSRGIKHTEEQPLYVDASITNNQPKESHSYSGLAVGAVAGIAGTSIIASKLLGKKTEK